MLSIEKPAQIESYLALIWPSSDADPRLVNWGGIARRMQDINMFLYWMGADASMQRDIVFLCNLAMQREIIG